MKLLKSLTVLVFLLSTTLACAQWGNGKKINGNKDITTITRSMESYNGLKAAGPMDFILVEGKEGQISIQGDSNIVEYIVTEVRNNQLVVKVKDGFNIRPSKTIVITIPYETLDNVSLAGSGDVKNTGMLKTEDLVVSLSGSGDIDLNVSAQTIESTVTGSGNIDLKGTTTSLKVKITGSGDFDGENLKSNNVNAEVTGSGGANVVCNGELKARVTGSGDIRYSGNPTIKDTKVTGSGSIRN